MEKEEVGALGFEPRSTGFFWACAHRGIDAPVCHHYVSKLVVSHFPIKLEPVRMPDYPMLPVGAGIFIKIFIDCGLRQSDSMTAYFMKSLHSLQYQRFRGGMNFRS